MADNLWQIYQENALAETQTFDDGFPVSVLDSITFGNVHERPVIWNLVNMVTNLNTKENFTLSDWFDEDYCVKQKQLVVTVHQIFPPSNKSDKITTQQEFFSHKYVVQFLHALLDETLVIECLAESKKWLLSLVSEDKLWYRKCYSSSIFSQNNHVDDKQFIFINDINLAEYVT